jgi:DNA-binding beta-propeller fold protein YncE
MKRTALLFFLLLLFSESVPAEPGRFAYVLKYDGPEEYLVKFDIETDSITKEIKLPKDSCFNNFVVDEKGGCYISRFRDINRYSNEIYYYDPTSEKIKRFVGLGNIFGPHYLVLTKDQLIARVYGNRKLASHVKGGVVFIDRKTGRIKNEIFLQENNPDIYKADIRDLYFDGKNRLFLSTFYWGENLAELGNGNIFVIDTDKKEITQTIPVPREYNNLNGVFSYSDKIYLACEGKGEHAENDELLVFSFEKGSLIKKIKVSHHPYKLLFDPKETKLYVQHTSVLDASEEVEVIDPKTDKIIDRIQTFDSRMFSLVKPGKIYITYGSYYTRPGLMVIDTRTDKIIKRFDGDYLGISEKSYVD